MKFAARFILIAVIALLPLTEPVEAAKLGTAELLRWTCPGPTQGGPARDADSSRTYLHVVDAAGNDFKVRCINGFTGWYYEFYVSFPNGTEEVLSRCIYWLGFNDLQLIYTGTLTETTNANGTPILTVGTLDIVEHSNVEGTGLAGNMTVKPGGQDFHVVHDFKQGHRYRLNTVGGRAESTDLLSRNVSATGSSITRAGMVALASPADYAPEMARDTSFRALDNDEVLAPCDDCNQAPMEDDPAKQLGFERLEGANGSSLLFWDPELRGSTISYSDSVLVVEAPARQDRHTATLALHPQRLLGASADDLVFNIDGRTASPVWIEHSDMVRVALDLDAASHVIKVFSGQAGTGSRFGGVMALLLAAGALALILAITLLRRRT